MTSISNMLFSFAFALYFLALYVYGIKFSKKKNKKKNKVRTYKDSFRVEYKTADWVYYVKIRCLVHILT